MAPFYCLTAEEVAKQMEISWARGKAKTGKQGKLKLKFKSEV